MSLASRLAALAIAAIAPGNIAQASDQVPTIDGWEVIGQAENRMVVLRNLAPPGHGKLVTRMAREYRFKGAAQTATLDEAIDQKKSGFFKMCQAPSASELSGYQIGGYDAVFVRLDCSATKKRGDRQTILMTAWVERNDLQTKEVLFAIEPTEADVAMAMAFLTRPAAASIPKM